MSVNRTYVSLVFAGLSALSWAVAFVLVATGGDSTPWSVSGLLCMSIADRMGAAVLFDRLQEQVDELKRARLLAEPVRAPMDAEALAAYADLNRQLLDALANGRVQQEGE